MAANEIIKVMVSRGYRKRACSVVLVNKVKNPIKLAREMLVRGEEDGRSGGNGGDGDPSGGSGGAQGHCCLGGDTVEKLADEWGLDMVDESYFWTRKRWDEHRKGLRQGSSPCLGTPKELLSETAWDGKDYLPQGTVGCVALDQYGTLCVATSTGGLTNKLRCRIGDTPTIGAGFWAEEWNDSPLDMRPMQPARSILARPSMGLNDVAEGLKNMLGDCFPTLNGYSSTSTFEPYALRGSEKHLHDTHAVAVSGTGNGDSFLRLAAARTAGAIVRFSSFSPPCSLASAINQIAGPGGELQRSAGDRWGETGEGEGGMIGIEFVKGEGVPVFDFNCGGMFRCWADEMGKVRVGVFKEDY